jgi:hypothetical protein
MRSALLAGLLILVLQAGYGREFVSLTAPSGMVRGEVVRVTPLEVVLKTTTGREETVPAAFLKPKDICVCRRQLLAPGDAQGHFDLGEYCLKNKLMAEAKEEFAIARRLDEKAFGAKADALLKSCGESGAGVSVAKGQGSADGKGDAPGQAGNGDSRRVSERSEGEFVEIKTRDGRTIQVPRQFLASRENVPARSPEEMKKFLDGQLELLKKYCSGDWGKDGPREWEMEETAHFYIFSNLKPEHRTFFKTQCEELYKLLAEVLEHKEGDPLWNNKCPIYFLSNREQFIDFGINIDHTEVVKRSGGYFFHRGREVHIVVPLLCAQRGESEVEQIRRATSTLRHEGTHAFLQLVGKNVQISRWLHEGMAQFIEFWYDAANNPDRRAVERRLSQLVNQDEILDWEEGRNRPDVSRPAGDHDGYAFAWSRIVYLYRAFQNDRRKLPTMIRLLKEGKSEKEALEQAFGQKVEKLEEVYRQFMKQAVKAHFKDL